MAVASHTSNRWPTLQTESLLPALSKCLAVDGIPDEEGHWAAIKRAVHVRSCRTSAVEMDLDWTLIGGIRAARGSSVSVQGEAAAMRMAARCLVHIAVEAHMPTTTCLAIVEALAHRVGAVKVPDYLRSCPKGPQSSPPTDVSKHPIAAASAGTPPRPGPALQEDVIRVADAVRRAWYQSCMTLLSPATACTTGQARSCHPCGRHCGGHGVAADPACQPCSCTALCTCWYGR